MFQTLSTNERQFLLTAIGAGVRADARTALETRLLRSAHLASLDDSSVDSLRFGQENGQVIVKLGQTKVLTQSTLKIVTPKEGRPNEGDLRFNIEFSSLTHSAEFNQQTNCLAEMRIEIQNFIEKVVKSSRVTDREAQHFLNVHHLPVCSTFYFVPRIDEPIVDATSKEERLATARLSICMNIYEDVCGMQTLGQMEVDPMQLISCSRQALEIAAETTKLVRRAWEQRDRLPMLEMVLNQQTDNVKLDNTASAQAFINQMQQGKVDKVASDDITETAIISKIKKSRRKEVGNFPASESKDDDGDEVSLHVANAAVREKKQKMQEISMKDPSELSLTTAVKRKRDKK